MLALRALKKSSAGKRLNLIPAEQIYYHYYYVNCCLSQISQVSEAFNARFAPPQLHSPLSKLHTKKLRNRAFVLFIYYCDRQIDMRMSGETGKHIFLVEDHIICAVSELIDHIIIFHIAETLKVPAAFILRQA